MSQEQKQKEGHDERGRFVAGNQKPKAPGELIEQHPTIHYRDSKGRILPGCNIAGRGSITVRQAELKKALQNAITEEQVQTAILDVYNTALTTDDVKGKAALWSLFFDRILGKATKEILLTKHETKVTAKLDLTKLSNDELQALQETMRKAIPSPEVPAITYTGDDA